MTFLTADGSHICTPFRPDLATLIPHARVLDYRGEKMLVVPNGRDEAKVARNLGISIPPPILTRYDWCARTARPPWAIQKTTAALLTESPRAYVLNSMGTGKTLAALFAADYLIKTKQVTKVVISSPLSTLTPVWESELFGYFPHLKVRVLYGDRAKRFKLLAEDADVYIVNHHGVVMMADALALRVKGGIMIIDELAVMRRKTTNLWKAHATVVNAMKFAWGMTGSPTPTAPTDAWGQVKLLTPDNTTKTLGQFQDQTMRRLTQFKWVPRQDANTTVHQAMQPSVRFTRDDIAELPPTTYVDREVKLEPLAAKAYKSLFDKMKVSTAAGQDITAVNEGVLQNKLLQVACGFIYTDKKEVYALPNQVRLDALEDTIAETDRKVIVFVPFVHALQGVHDHLKKLGHDVALVHGGTSRSKRDFIFRGFQHGESPRIIVAHPGCMAHGLTLTAANVIVWYAPTTSLEIYEQANARIVRPGQTAKTLIAHLYGTPVERATYARLKTRGKMQGMLLALFRQQELDF